MGILIVIAVAVRLMLPKFQTVPKGIQNGIEIAVDMFDGMVKSSSSEGFLYLGNWFFMVFAFILFSNIGGVFGLRPPTADWATTFALAFATFIIIQIVGIRNRKGSYLKSFFKPIFIFFPLNLIGELARPVSLSFRLFGNVLAGVILMTLIYSMAPIYVRFLIPTALHAYFDIFSGAIQTYIFCVLSISFISSSAEEM